MMPFSAARVHSATDPGRPADPPHRPGAGCPGLLPHAAKSRAELTEDGLLPDPRFYTADLRMRWLKE